MSFQIMATGVLLPLPALFRAVMVVPIFATGAADHVLRMVAAISAIHVHAQLSSLGTKSVSWLLMVLQRLR